MILKTKEELKAEWVELNGQYNRSCDDDYDTKKLKVEPSQKPNNKSVDCSLESLLLHNKERVGNIDSKNNFPYVCENNESIENSK